jgi:excisionase family DNA binding protein
MPARPALPKLTTVAAAADYLGVSQKTIRQWIREGRLPAVRAGQRCIRIAVADLEKLTEPCGPGGVSDPVERIARMVEASPLSDDDVDRLATLLRSGTAR